MCASCETWRTRNRREGRLIEDWKPGLAHCWSYSFFARAFRWTDLTFNMWLEFAGSQPPERCLWILDEMTTIVSFHSATSISLMLYFFYNTIILETKPFLRKVVTSYLNLVACRTLRQSAWTPLLEVLFEGWSFQWNSAALSVGKANTGIKPVDLGPIATVKWWRLSALARNVSFVFLLLWQLDPYRGGSRNILESWGVWIERIELHTRTKS